MSVLLASLLLGTGCTGGTDTVDSGAMVIGPAMSHTEPEGPFVAGVAIAMSVVASDLDGVEEVDLVYRTQESEYWETLPLTAQTGSDAWSGEVPESDVATPGLDYYFRARDAVGITTFLPQDNANSSFALTVSDKGASLPFTEDFEDYTSGYGPLYSLGWASVSDGFAGYAFEITEADAWDGVVAVWHARGFDGISGMDDWLVAPALDFEGQDRVQVTWWERGQSTEGADHSLWVSTLDRDPRNGTHVEVATLDAPSEDGWERSAVIDLSDWVGQPVVHLAWRYVGSYVDDWYLDGVSVREMTCDPSLAVTWNSEVVLPGETVDVDVDVVNAVDLSCAGLTATVSFPDGGAEAANPEIALGDLEGLGSVAGTTVVTVDSNWPENSYLPVLVTLSDGVETWSLSEDLVVGLPSELRLDLEVDTEGLVQIVVGVGDPEEPTWSFDLTAATLAAGAYSYTADLTDHYDLLPPGSAGERWFAHIEASGSGAVTSMEIDYAATTYAATVKPEWWGDEDVVVWVPEPPAPSLSLVTTYPTIVAPGDTADLSLTLRNEGAATAGTVSATLSTSESAVTILDGGPQDLTSGAWAEGASESLGSPFSFQIGSDHVDSTALAFELTLTDGLETWVLPLEIAVPWVVIKATSVVIDDATGGNGDGLLDAGETATLEIELTNVGDLDADGFVDAALFVEGTSTAGVTIDNGEDSLSTLYVESTRTAEFQVTVDAGSASGDTLDLRVDTTDDRSTYSSPATITLGEPPWLSVSSVDDDTEDAFDYTVDLVNVLYRSDGESLELLFHTAEAYDSSTAFVEMWGVASGGDYSWYRMVMQSGTALLQGYDSDFYELAEPTVEFPSSTEIKISWLLADMGSEDLNSLRVGFGAGWCAADTDSFCDHFPDGWGYYYHDTYTDSRFFTLQW